MSLKVQIEDPKTGLVAEVVDGTEPNALVVASRPLKKLTNNIIPFLSDEFGLDMNQNGATGGIPRIIYDGGTTPDVFVPEATVGVWDFTTGGVVTQVAGENNDLATFTTTSHVVTVNSTLSPSIDIFSVNPPRSSFHMAIVCAESKFNTATSSS